MLALVYSSTPPRSVEESSFRSGNNGEHQRPALDVAVNVACSASAGSLRFLKCYSHRFNKSQFSLIVAVSSPTETFLFCVLHGVSVCAGMVVGIESKIGASSVPYGLSRGSPRWGGPFPLLARLQHFYTAHLSSFAIPKTRTVPHLILVHAIVSQLRSLALGRGG